MISIEDSIVNDKRLILQTGQAARVLSIGTSWSTIRIGARLAFDDLGVTVRGNPRFYMGVLSSPSAGLANGPLTDTTSHFVGNIDQGTSWVRATSPTRYTVASSTSAKGKKVGATVTGIATAGGQRLYSGDTTIRVIQIGEIVKGSPNFTIRLAQNTSTSTPADTTITQLETAMEAASMVAAVAYLDGEGIGDYVNVSSSDTAIAVDEGTDGSLDAICVAWSIDSPACYVSEVLFNKIA